MTWQALASLAGGLMWIAIVGLLLWRLKRRRSYIGAGAAGAVYEMLNEDKRKAVELIVEEKTGERDPERATGPAGDRIRHPK